jgi:hypothetical protein
MGKKPKNNVFGVPLDKKSTVIPTVLKSLVDHFDRTGLFVDFVVLQLTLTLKRI